MRKFPRTFLPPSPLVLLLRREMKTFPQHATLRILSKEDLDKKKRDEKDFPSYLFFVVSANPIDLISACGSLGGTGGDRGDSKAGRGQNLGLPLPLSPGRLLCTVVRGKRSSTPPLSLSPIALLFPLFPSFSRHRPSLPFPP